MNDFYFNPSVREHLERWGVDPTLIDIIEDAPPGAQGRMVAKLRQDPNATAEQLRSIAQRYSTQQEKLLSKQKLDDRERQAAQLWGDPDERRWFEKQLVRWRKQPWSNTMLNSTKIGEVQDFIERNNFHARLAGFTWPTLLQQSDEWHAAVAGVGRSKNYIESNVALDFGDGWTVQRIMNSHDMQVEGARMSGCQGSYGEDVERGLLFVYSLRDPKNEPHVTIGIRRGAVIQIKGKNNDYPKKDYHPYLIEFLRQVILNNPRDANTEIALKNAKTLPQFVMGVTVALGGDLKEVDEGILRRLSSKR